ncbi:hypothetical protein IAR50_006572 [Cryptococcus sp. DSM 104548]
MPLLKKRAQKDGQSFLTFDLPSLRARPSRTTPDPSPTPTAAFPAHSFSPFSPGARSCSSRHGRPGIQHLMDAYDTSPRVQREMELEYEREEKAKSNRGTIKLPPMPPPPSGSSYGRQKRESWEVDEWTRGGRGYGGSSTQPSTPDVPSFDNRHRTQSMNVVPPRAPPLAPSRAPPPPPLPAYPRETHDVWGGEDEAVVMLEEMSGRIMSDGWGYGREGGERGTARGQRASSQEHSNTAPHSPLPPVPNTAPLPADSVRSWREARKKTRPARSAGPSQRLPPPPAPAPSQPPPQPPAPPSLPTAGLAVSLGDRERIYSRISAGSSGLRGETQETKLKPQPQGRGIRHRASYTHVAPGSYIPPPAPVPRGAPPQPPTARVVTTTITAGSSAPAIGTRYTSSLEQGNAPPIPRRSSARPSYPSSKQKASSSLATHHANCVSANTSSISLLDPAQHTLSQSSSRASFGTARQNNQTLSTNNAAPTGLTIKDMFRARSSTSSSAASATASGGGGGVREWVKVDRRGESDEDLREGRMEVIDIPKDGVSYGRSLGHKNPSSAVSVSPKSQTIGLPSEWTGSARRRMLPRDDHPMGSALEENHLGQSLAKAHSPAHPPPSSSSINRTTKPRANTATSTTSSLSPSFTSGPPVTMNSTNRHIARKASSSARSASSSTSSTSVVSGAVAPAGSRGGQVSGMDAVGGLPDFSALGSVMKGLRGRFGSGSGKAAVASPYPPTQSQSQSQSQQSSSASLGSPYVHVDSHEGSIRPWADRLAPAPASSPSSPSHGPGSGPGSPLTLKNAPLPLPLPSQREKEDMYIIPPSERSKIGEEEVRKERRRSKRMGMDRVFGRIGHNDEKERDREREDKRSSVAGSDTTSTSECSLFVPKPAASPALGGSQTPLEGVKEEYRSAKEVNAAKHQSLHLAQEQRAKALLASLSSPTATTPATSHGTSHGTSGTGSHPPTSFTFPVHPHADPAGLALKPTPLSVHTTQEWEEDEWAREQSQMEENEREKEKEKERKGLLPPPRPTTRGKGSVSEEVDGREGKASFDAPQAQASAHEFLTTPPITPPPHQSSQLSQPASQPISAYSPVGVPAPDKRKKEAGEEKRLRRKASWAGQAVGLEVELNGSEQTGSGRGGGGGVKRRGSVPYPTPITPKPLAALKSAISPSPSLPTPALTPKQPTPSAKPLPLPIPAEPSPRATESSPSIISHAHSTTSTTSTPTSSSGSSADFIKEREEKERQRRVLMDMWLDAKPIRGQKGGGGGTAPPAFGAGGRKVSGGAGGRPGTSTGQTSSGQMAGLGEKQAMGCLRRASLDGRRLSGV